MQCQTPKGQEKSHANCDCWTGNTWSWAVNPSTCHSFQVISWPTGRCKRLDHLELIETVWSGRASGIHRLTLTNQNQSFTFKGFVETNNFFGQPNIFFKRFFFRKNTHTIHTFEKSPNISEKIHRLDCPRLLLGSASCERKRKRRIWHCQKWKIRAPLAPSSDLPPGEMIRVW